MARIKPASINLFQNAVAKCPEIAESCKSGLTAMGSNSTTVSVGNSRLIDGSVDIDEAVKDIRPNESRWDYAIGYSGEAYFIEVHPADTKNVEEMLKKVSWLKAWLNDVAPDLKRLHKCGVYHWIPSGRNKILKTSVQYRKISANNLAIVNPLRLN